MSFRLWYKWYAHVITLINYIIKAYFPDINDKKMKKFEHFFCNVFFLMSIFYEVPKECCWILLHKILFFDEEEETSPRVSEWVI